ncbi:uncharacterized protein PG986_012041 [Apiospora aurea]|uniref:MARVEL domain-containing protein n=1 Tax=Apiospora aurea TaxID=335848 RepID=A0ABR1PYV0_9PEZI
MGYTDTAFEMGKSHAKSKVTATATTYARKQVMDKGFQVINPAQKFELVARWIARGLQLIFALIVVGFYAHRVDEDRKAGKPQSAAWCFAVFTAGISSITTVVYSIPFVIKSARLWSFDLFLFILWIATFGTFAGIFLKRESGTKYEGTSVRAMKVAVWLDLVNCIFWLITGVYGFCRTFCSKWFGDKIDRVFKKGEKKVGEGIDMGFDGARDGVRGAFSKKKQPMPTQPPEVYMV